MSPTTLTEKAHVVGKAILSGTSTVLDIAYELSGRRAGILHKSAAFLYDIAQDGEEPSNGRTAKPAAKVAKPTEKAKKPAAKVKKPAAKAKKAKKAAKPVEKVSDGKKAAEPKKASKPAKAKKVVADNKSVTAEAKPTMTDEQPIAGYDAMNVKAVQKTLDSLSADEVDKVRLYETAHKNRKTVLRAIAQLAKA